MSKNLSDVKDVEDFFEKMFKLAKSMRVSVEAKLGEHLKDLSVTKQAIELLQSPRVVPIIINRILPNH